MFRRPEAPFLVKETLFPWGAPGAGLPPEGPRRPRALGSAAQLLPPSPGSSFRNRSDTSLVDYARTTVSQPPERGARCSGAASESVQPGAGVHLVWSPSPGKDAVRPRTPGDRGQGTGDGLPSRHHPPRSVVRRALGAGRAFCGPEPCALGPGPSPSLSSSLPSSSSSSPSPSPSSGIPQEAHRSLSGGGEGGSRVTTETPRFSIRAAAGPSSAARVLPAAGRRPAVPAQARPGLPTCTPSSPGSGRTRSPWAAEVGSLRGEKLRSSESDESVTRGSPRAQLPRLCQRRRRSTPGRGALDRLSQDRTAGFYDAGRLCRLPAGPNLPQCASN